MKQNIDLTMHKLLGDHKWVQKGIKTICSICGLHKGNDSVPFIFSTGDSLSSSKMNANFGSIIGVVRQLDKRTKKLEKRIEDMETLNI